MPDGSELVLDNLQIKGHKGLILEEPDGLPVPDPRYDIAVSVESEKGPQKEYIRQWPIEELPEWAQTHLKREEPKRWEWAFSCKAHVKVPERTEQSHSMNELDQSFEVSGSVVSDVEEKVANKRIMRPVEQSTIPIDSGEDT